MPVFTAGAGGADVLQTISAGGAVLSETVSATQITLTFASGDTAILSGHFTLTDDEITAGILTGWSSYSGSTLNWSFTGLSADINTVLADEKAGLYDAIADLVITSATTYYGSTNSYADDLLAGRGNDAFIGGAADETFQPAGGNNIITGGTGHNTVAFSGGIADYTILNQGDGKLLIFDSDLSRNGIDHITGVQTLQFSDVSAAVGSDGELTLQAVTVSQALTWSHVNDVGSLQITDTTANVLANLSSLETLASDNLLGQIKWTDLNVGSLTATSSQLTADLDVFKAIKSPATLTIDASAANLTLTGAANIGTVAVFTGTAADYTITADGNGAVTVTDIGTGRTSVDHLTDFTALQFSDQTVIIAAAPGTGDTITSGNIAEIYSAALAREPDVAGLAFYRSYLVSYPNTPLWAFAGFLTHSTEYLADPAHDYTDDTAGNTQFITDIYTDLLHRAPEAGAVNFYLDYIASQSTGLLPDSNDYLAREKVLAFISQSAEFLADVTVKGTPDAQHWLIIS